MGLVKKMAVGFFGIIALLGAVMLMANVSHEIETDNMLRGLSEDEQRMFKLRINACEDVKVRTLMAGTDLDLSDIVFEECIGNVRADIAAARSGG